MQREARPVPPALGHPGALGFAPKAVIFPAYTVCMVRPHGCGATVLLWTGKPAMPSDDAALEPSSVSWLLHALAAGFGGVLATALLLGVFGGGMPRPVHAEAEAAPSAPNLCFNGPGSEFLNVAPVGQRCR